MNLDQLLQEAENLKSVDAANLTPEQLIQLAEKLSRMMDVSETSLLDIKTQLEEIKVIENEDTLLDQ